MSFKKFGTTVMAGLIAASMMAPVAPVFADDGTRVGDNVITKTVKAEDGVSFDESFKYTFTQGETNVEDSGVIANTKTAAIPQVTINGTADGKYTANTDTTGVKSYAFNGGTVDLSAITDSGVYTYTVTEDARTVADDGQTWVYDTKSYTLRVYATYDSDGSLTKSMTMQDVNGNKLETATFENSVTKTAAFLRVGKLAESTDGLEPAGQTYKFTVSFNTGDLNTPPESYSYYLTNGTDKGEVKTITSGGTIEMTAGQWAEFTNVPAGTEVVVKEIETPSNIANVKASVVIDGAEYANKEPLTDDYETQSILVHENGTTITYTNTWKNIAVTGIVTNNAPYIALVALVAGAGALYFGLKKRIAR